MRSKRFSFVAVVVALAMLLPLVLGLFTACGDGDGDGGKGGAGKFVTDNDLKDKLLTMYTFEENNPSGGDALLAYDPYTGKAIEESNGTYDTTVNRTATVSIGGLTQDDYTLETSSTRALDSSYAINLGGTLNSRYAKTGETDTYGNVIPDYSRGVSVSFWAYNYEQDKTISSGEAGTLAIDYANVVNNGMQALTWGNLNNVVQETVTYPSGQTKVGRAAYTDEFITGEEGTGSYYEARSKYSTEQIGWFDTAYADARYTYTGWNAISGNIQDADEDSVVGVLSDYCYQTWRYVTITIAEDGVYFYMNGRLAYYYSAAAYFAADPGWAGSGVIDSPDNNMGIYYQYIWGLIGGSYSDDLGDAYPIGVGGFGFIFDMFGYSAKAYVDDLLIGYALSADEAQALYENLSGVTYEAKDIALTTGLSQEESDRNNAMDAAMAERLEQYQQNIKNDATEGAFTATKRDEFINADGVNTVKAEQGWYEFISNSTSVDDGVANGIGTGIYKPTYEDDGTFKMQVTALQLSEGNNDWEGIYALVGQNVSTTAQSVASIQGSAGMDHYALNLKWGASGGTGKADSPKDVWMQGVDTEKGTGHTLVFTKPVDDDGTTVLFKDVQRYCWVVITFEWNGRSLRLTLDYYYYFVGETLTGTMPDDSTFQFEAPIGPGTWYGSVTLNIQPAENETRTIDEIVNVEDLGICFAAEDSELLITKVEGGTAAGVTHAPATENAAA